MSNNRQFRGIVMLMLTAIIWGASFVSQSIGMENVGAFTFNGIRTLMGAVVLLPFVLLRERKLPRPQTAEQLAARKAATKQAIVAGVALGLVFCAAGNFQQFAFYYSTSGKIAFITALYMFFVPLFGLFLKKRVPALTWICVVFGFVGLYFLCFDGSGVGSLNFGDILAFFGSILFAIHILLIERYAQAVDGVKLSCIQFFVAGAVTCLLMALFEEPQAAAIRSAIIPLLYSGILSCGLAYTFQIIGQKYTEATAASLVLCLESVFAVLFAALILKEILSGREVVGCVIMFAAIVLSQLAELLTRKMKQRKA